MSAFSALLREGRTDEPSLARGQGSSHLCRLETLFPRLKPPGKASSEFVRLSAKYGCRFQKCKDFQNCNNRPFNQVQVGHRLVKSALPPGPPGRMRWEAARAGSFGSPLCAFLQGTAQGALRWRQISNREGSVLSMSRAHSSNLSTY